MRILHGDENRQTLGFILPPRTGSRSIDQAIGTLGARSAGGRHQVPDPLPKVDCVISAIRNPYDVIVSWYGSQGPPNGGVGEKFDVFLERVLAGGHAYMRDGTTLPGAKLADRVIRFEVGIWSGLNFLLTEFGYPPVKVEHVGKTCRRPYREHFNPDQQEAVRRAFADDFTRFDYRW